MKRLKSHKLDHHIEGIGRIRVYDKPSTVDRYTIVYLDGVEDIPCRPRAISILGTAANPHTFSGFEEIESVGSHLGRIIPFASLPLMCQKAAKYK